MVIWFKIKTWFVFGNFYPIFNHLKFFNGLFVILKSLDIWKCMNIINKVILFCLLASWYCEKIFISCNACCSIHHKSREIDLRNTFETLLIKIWGKVFKNGPSEICGRQPLKKLKLYGLFKQTISLQTFLRLSSTNFTWSIFWILCPIYRLVR